MLLLSKRSFYYSAIFFSATQNRLQELKIYILFFIVTLLWSNGSKNSDQKMSKNIRPNDYDRRGSYRNVLAVADSKRRLQDKILFVTISIKRNPKYHYNIDIITVVLTEFLLNIALTSQLPPGWEGTTYF